jgi:hypothetical protein
MNFIAPLDRLIKAPAEAQRPVTGWRHFTRGFVNVNGAVNNFDTSRSRWIAVTRSSE